MPGRWPLNARGEALAPVLGAANVVSLAGGINAWKQAGLPTIRG